MRAATKQLWAQQDRHEGDRHRLFEAIADTVDAETVLYPGSFVDVAASFVFDSVTYVDSDTRAKKFFGDTAGVAELVAEHSEDDDREPEVTFIKADYTKKLDLENESFDLLVSLYGGFVSEHCTQYLRVGGFLLVNGSHGDASMASIDERYQLVGVVTSRAGEYRVTRHDLNSYFVPKKRNEEITPELLHELGKSVSYTKTPFAYLFERVE